MKLVHIKVLWF